MLASLSLSLFSSFFSRAVLFSRAAQFPASESSFCGRGRWAIGLRGRGGRVSLEKREERRGGGVERKETKPGGAGSEKGSDRKRGEKEKTTITLSI